MTVPNDIKQAYYKYASPGPLSYRWAFDPNTAEVHLTHDEKPNLEVEYHEDLAKRVNHPEAVQGNAHRIHKGWRILDLDHKPVTDEFIARQVHKALRQEG